MLSSCTSIKSGTRTASTDAPWPLPPPPSLEPTLPPPPLPPSPSAATAPPPLLVPTSPTATPLPATTVPTPSEPSTLPRGRLRLRQMLRPIPTTDTATPGLATLASGATEDMVLATAVDTPALDTPE